MSTPKISVIVPVYNVEQYLPRCIDSILDQTFTDFELLLIDDGSKDKSGEICDNYAKKDSRIRVFHKENGGVSSARNLGLDNVWGNYIVFIDADDHLYQQDTFNLPFQTFECESIDIIEMPYSNNGTFKKRHTHKIIGKQNIDKYYANHIHNEVWGRIYAKRVINGTRFITSIKIGEDITFFLSLYRRIKSLYISDKGGYLYERNEQSVMEKSTKEDERAQIETYLSFIEKLQIQHKEIIGFYLRTANYIWLKRKQFTIMKLDFLKYFTLYNIIFSHLSFQNKLRFMITRYRLLFLYK